MSPAIPASSNLVADFQPGGANARQALQRSSTVFTDSTMSGGTPARFEFSFYHGKPKMTMIAITIHLTIQIIELLFQNV